jgi:hypothetical protein
MKQKKRIILLLVLLFAAALIGANHRAISLIRNNLTTRQISLPDTASWSGGKAYLQVPYSDVSETDYLNLYVPENASEEELKAAFMLRADLGDETVREDDIGFMTFSHYNGAKNAVIIAELSRLPETVKSPSGRFSRT